MDAADTAVHAELQRDVGRLEGKVEALDTRCVAMDAKLDRVLSHIEREKGSKRAFGLVGTVGGSIAGAIFGAVVAWFTR